ncbi:pantoate--beta-alanine ligase [Thalassotalea sp. PS06]|uniref:pantoate--beta-alanine ligase n=1 Tax=Thalassotalea sp. PS06 TaxID=2594005 RepID=UPI001161D75E|nr:pantoate--beta-alanine ligase [Thalassotalea sp. PS06]QDP00124.1 pantoate--beta-alanine ligase [Thalassotalea sp. PS06]
MKTVESIIELRSVLNQFRAQGLTIGFVPTMGNLHHGHLSLVDEAKQQADIVVASIFINPMQFGVNEDIDNYPRTLEKDKEKLVAAGVEILFTPTPDIIYPKGLDKQTFVEVPGLSSSYCGESRKGHFRGVTTIVCKLFNLVQPDIACFGLKDYQQVQMIQTMVDDLSMPIKIIPVATKREDSGLAMSSRNTYLSDAEKAQATALYKTLQWVKSRLAENQEFEKIELIARSKIDAAGMRTDYIDICNAETLEPASAGDSNLVVLAAAHCGKARLIDNIQVSLS